MSRSLFYGVYSHHGGHLWRHLRTTSLPKNVTLLLFECEKWASFKKFCLPDPAPAVVVVVSVGGDKPEPDPRSLPDLLRRRNRVWRDVANDRSSSSYPCEDPRTGSTMNCQIKKEIRLKFYGVLYYRRPMLLAVFTFQDLKNRKWQGKTALFGKFRTKVSVWNSSTVT